MNSIFLSRNYVSQRWLKLIFTFLILICVAISSRAQSCSSISIYRPNVFSNSLVALSIYVNGIKVYDLNNNSSVEIFIKDEGSYSVSARWFTRGDSYRKRTEKTVAVTCGNSYFLEVKSGALDASVLLQPVSNAQSELSLIPNQHSINLDKNDGVVKHQEVAIAPEQLKTETNRGVEKENNSPSSVSNDQPTIEEKGRNFAFIIGIGEYSDNSMNDLDEPVSDALKIKEVLINHYTFNANDVILLKNPTKNDITAQLDYLFKKVGKEDNLFIFYAGHGFWDEQFKQGYWLPSDASRDNRGTWLSNGTIRDYIRAIPSKHTLLVTDACFGGGIFKSRNAFANSSTAINQLYRYPSRKAMTSGAMSEVPDKSVFVEYLVKRLENNSDKYLSSEQLFSSFKLAVINNSANAQVPQFGEIRETGDEGGDFIFVRKNQQ